MKLSFMTFLYPQLGYEGIIAKAVQFGYQGIEWRAEADHNHGVELDVPTAQIHTIRQAVADAGLETSCLAVSSRFCSPDVAEREANLERLARYVELAGEIGAPCIRIFADPIPNTGRGGRAESYRYQAEYLRRAAENAAQGGVKLALETHSVFRAFDAGEVMYQAAYPAALWINWHLAHCINNGEDVDEAYRHVKGRVIHAHFGFYGKPKDPSAERPSTKHFVERQMELLADEGFQGYFSLEMNLKDEAESDYYMADHAAAWKAIYRRLYPNG